ncbi:MAG TPA: electron transport complex subunit RsxG [Chromatiaceae bacterium]|nr:electron transport complex subunit RsxG [Chromatiaceae bacterium]
MNRNIFISAAILGVFGILGSALVAVTWNATAERIALNQQQAFLRNVFKLIKRDEIDNEPLKDVISIHAPALAKNGVRVYRARRQGQPVAVIFSPIQAPGYASPITMMVAVRADGVLGGVRVLSHLETPGLGDKIEESRSDWILGFEGKSLQNPPPEKWKVRKDGGVFDQFTGATITPRSIVATVKKTLEYFEKEKERLFKQPTEPTTEAPFH